ncbi:hypothetical protein FIBSPDRAFT_877304 [Athelia psychrophila]|nr:hypothetical protein FIBSPDRAFT_877304 [Fibularhizoctonia sp. CBS 109695]
MLDDDNTRGPVVPRSRTCQLLQLPSLKRQTPLPHEQPTLTLPRLKAAWVTEWILKRLLRLGGGTLDGTAPTHSILYLSQTRRHCPPRRRLPTPYELQSGPTLTYAGR